MNGLSVDLEREDLIKIKYLISGIQSDKMEAGLSDGALALAKFMRNPIMIDANEFESLEDVLPYLSYWDERIHYWEIPRDSEGRTSAFYSSEAFCKELVEKNPDIFLSLINFMFLPAKKREGWVFSAETRGMMANIAVENKIFAPTVISHYFKLLSKSASREQMHRVKNWLEMPEVKQNKKLIMILARSKYVRVQVVAVDNADKSLYGFLIGDITDSVGKYYLEKKMANQSWSYKDVMITDRRGTKRAAWSLNAAYEAEKGKRP